jgi:phage gp36-like protein
VNRTLYADVADLASRALGLPPRALEKVSNTEKEDAITSASSLADGYIARGYVLPLTRWGDDLRWAVCVIAAYNLMAGRGFNPEGGDEQLRLRYEDALRWLGRISDGKVRPPGFVDSAEPATGTGANASSAGRISSNPRRGW